VTSHAGRRARSPLESHGHDVADALGQIGHGAQLASEADFTEEHGGLGDGNVEETAQYRGAHGQVRCRLTAADAADDRGKLNGHGAVSFAAAAAAAAR
jgi:hypothetical protein